MKMFKTQEESDPRFNWRRCVIVNWMKITKINRIIGFAVSMNLKFEVASRHEMIVNGYERNCLQEDGERNCLTNIHGCEIKKKKKKKKKNQKERTLGQVWKIKENTGFFVILAALRIRQRITIENYASRELLREFNIFVTLPLNFYTPISVF